ncbi:MAG: 50S ribosomal protein P1 [Candidatus Thermoplasmatota archaeon]|nr:50S ribosomal protein P1 [Candidatus Thermoplasmatota archaeon]
MEYVYSAMLLHSVGKEITEDNVEKVLKAAGVKPDPTRVKALTASLEGVDIEEAMSTAFSVPAAAAPEAAAPEEEEKKEKKEKKEEVSEEEAAAGLGALFG